MLNFQSPLGRLARAPLRLVPADAVVRVLSGPLRGAKWIRGSHTNGCWLGTYERETQRLLRTLIRPGMTVIDAGANVGFFTLLAARLVGPSGQVIAFEPFDTNAVALRRHIALNHLTNVKAEEFGLSNETGASALFYGNAANASMFPHTLGHPSVAISVVALDDWRASGRLPRIDFIKMDIEGAEGMAVQGMQQVIADDRPIAYISLHGGPGEAEISNVFRRHGYRCEMIGDALVCCSSSSTRAWSMLSSVPR